MPRQVKDAKIGNRTARNKLKRQGKPYYREISPGLHLGYRKLKTGGKWVVRLYIEGKYLTETMAVADDHDEADGIRILDYGQAQKLARKRAAELRATNASGHSFNGGNAAHKTRELAIASQNARLPNMDGEATVFLSIVEICS